MSMAALAPLAITAMPAVARGPLDEQLLRGGRLYRGGQSLAEREHGIASGLAELDARLPWGGFPATALTELLHGADGLGEFSLLLPALRQLGRSGPITLVNPPYVPYAPALQQQGLALGGLLWIAPIAERVLWSAEQCLRAGCLGAVLLWHDGGDERPLRRLQVAAESGQTAAFLFRPARHAANPSPAALRLQLEGGRLRVLKCRGAVAPVQPITLPSRSPVPGRTQDETVQRGASRQPITALSSRARPARNPG